MSTDYHVMPDGAGWTVLHDGEVVATAVTRAVAEQRAREVAALDASATIVIHSRWYDLEQAIPVGDRDGVHWRLR